MPELKIRKFGTNMTKAEKAEAAAERLRVDVQQLLFGLMRAKGWTQKDVAEELGVSAALVSRTFSTYGNLTLRQVARFACALGEELTVVPKKEPSARAQWTFGMSSDPPAKTTAGKNIYPLRSTKTKTNEVEVKVEVASLPLSADFAR